MVNFMGKTYKRWSPTDVAFIANNQNMLDKEIAVQLSELNGQIVTPSMVRRQRRKGGIAKKRGRPFKKIASVVAPQQVQ